VVVIIIIVEDYRTSWQWWLADSACASCCQCIQIDWNAGNGGFLSIF